jgi:molybdopterin converting factor small subunit
MNMKINVRLAEPFWRSVGQRDLTLEVDEGARVSDVVERLCILYPSLGKELAENPPLLFVDEHEVTPENLLVDGNRVYLMWPVAGG